MIAEQLWSSKTWLQSGPPTPSLSMFEVVSGNDWIGMAAYPVRSVSAGEDKNICSLCVLFFLSI